jgi:hypothetical protein
MGAIPVGVPLKSLDGPAGAIQAAELTKKTSLSTPTGIVFTPLPPAANPTATTTREGGLEPVAAEPLELT